MQLAVYRIFSVLVGSSIYSPRDAEYVSTIIFKLAPDGKIVRKVEFV